LAALVFETGVLRRTGAREITGTLEYIALHLPERSVWEGAPHGERLHRIVIERHPKHFVCIWRRLRPCLTKSRH
jgi:hypothetical protein